MVEDPISASGVLKVLHGVTKSSVPDFYLRCFAYMGDVQGAHIETVGLDTGLLESTADVQIFHKATQQSQYFTNNSGAQLHPAHADRDAGNRKLKIWCAMFIPYPLVGAVIDQDLTGRQALELLVPVIKDLCIEDVC